MKLLGSFLICSAYAQTEYNYYDNNYVYSNSNYVDYESSNYDLDGYTPTGFGNETDYVEVVPVVEVAPEVEVSAEDGPGENRDHHGFHPVAPRPTNPPRPPQTRPPRPPQTQPPRPPQMQPPRPPQPPRPQQKPVQKPPRPQQMKPPKAPVMKPPKAPKPEKKPARPNHKPQPPKDSHHHMEDHHDDHEDHYGEEHYDANHAGYDHDHYGEGKAPAYPPAYPAASAYDDGTGLSCWTCHADSWDLCASSGHLRKCLPNEDSCELEIRERKGFILQILTGCKAKDACMNNMANNFIGEEESEAITQCRPEGPAAGYMHSVCRQCCTESNCVKDPDWWYPQTRAEWAYTGEPTPYESPYEQPPY